MKEQALPLQPIPPFETVVKRNIAMKEISDNEKVSKQLKYSTGIRKVFLLAKLSDQLVNTNLAEAERFGNEGEALARKLLARIAPTDKRYDKYRRALGQTLSSLGLCLLRSQDYQRATQVLEEATTIFAETESWEEMLNTLYSLTAAYRDRNMIEAALEKVDYALQVCRQLNIIQLQGLLHAQKGLLHQHEFKLDEALAAFDKAMELIDLYTAEDKAHVFSSMGNLLHLLGRFAEADRSYEQATQLREELGNAFGLIIDKQNHSLALLSMNRPHDSANKLEEALTLARKGGFQNHEAHILGSLGRLYVQFGEYDRALAALLQAIRLYRSNNAEQAGLTTLAEIGRIHMLIGDRDAGRRYLKESIRLLDNTTDVSLHSYVYSILVEYELTEISPGDLIERLRTMKSREFPAGRVYPIRIRLSLGLALAKTGMLAAAESEYREAREMSAKFNDRCLAAEIRHSIGKLQLKMSDLPTALRELEEARAIVADCGNWSIRRRIEEDLAALHEQRGDFKAALQYHRQVAALEKEVVLTQAGRRVDRIIVSSNVEQLERQCEELREREQLLAKEVADRKHALSLHAAREEHNRLQRDRLRKSLRSMLNSPGSPRAVDVRNLLLNIDSVAVDVMPAAEYEVQHQDAEFVRLMKERYPKLTASEMSVCALIRAGHSTKEIAARLHVSARAVETYRYRVRRKLALGSGVSLAAFLAEI